MSARSVTLAVALALLAIPSAASAEPVFTPDPVQFADREVGTESPALDVTVTNDAGEVYEVADVLLDGGDAGDFEIVSDSCSGMDLGETSACVVSLRFAPTAAGDRLTLLVLENAGAGDDFGVFAVGYAYDRPALDVTPSLSFPATRRGATATSSSAVLTNVGEGPVQIGTAAVEGPDAFIVNNPCLGVTLEPGDSCGLPVAYRPSKVGPETATLVVQSDAANAPHGVPLSGEGLPAGAIRVEPPALDFGVLRSRIFGLKEVVVHNVGDNMVRLAPATAGSPLTGSASSGRCTIDPGASCRMRVRVTGRNPGPLALDLQLREWSTGDTLATLPVRAVVERVARLVPWRGRAQLDRPLAAAMKRWRRAGRAKLMRRGFPLRDLRINLGGRVLLDLYAVVPRGSASATRLIAHGRTRVQPGIPRDLRARTTRAGRRLLRRAKAVRLRAELIFVAVDGRQFATTRKARLPARRR